MPETTTADAGKKISIDEFGASVKQKYPQYSGKSDFDVGQAMLRKFPQYGAKLKTEPEKKPGYLSRLFGNAAESVFNIKDSLMGAGKNVTKDFDALKGDVQATGKNPKNFLKTLGFMADTAGNVAGAAGNALVQAADVAVSPVSQIRTPEGDTVGERFAKPIKKVIGDVAASPSAGAIKEGYEKAIPEDVRKKTGNLASVLGLVAPAKVPGPVIPGVDAAIQTGKAIKGAAQAIPATARATGSVVKDLAATGVPKVAPAVSGAKSIGAGLAEGGLEHLTGLKPEVFKEVMSKPQQYTPEKIKQASRQSLAESIKEAAQKQVADIQAKRPKVEDLGEEIKNAVISRKQALSEHSKKYPVGKPTEGMLPGETKRGVKLEPNWLLDQLENKEIAGVTIDNKGRVLFGDANSPINQLTSPNGAKRLEDLFSVWGPKFAEGQISRGEFIKFRQDLAQVANYKGGVDTELERVAHRIRDNFNKEYRKQIGGLEKLDAEHTTMTRDYDRLTKGLSIEDDLGRVQLQEGALSKLLNSTKETKADTLKQLEELSPGIGAKIKAIEESDDAATRITQGLIDEKGNLTETAANKIVSGGAPGKDVLMERLKGLVPDIEDRIKFVRTVEALDNASGIKVGTYLRGALGAGAGLTLNVPLMMALALTHPAALVPILRGVGVAGGKAQEVIGNIRRLSAAAKTRKVADILNAKSLGKEE